MTINSEHVATYNSEKTEFKPTNYARKPMNVFHANRYFALHAKRIYKKILHTIQLCPANPMFLTISFSLTCAYIC